MPGLVQTGFVECVGDHELGVPAVGLDLHLDGRVWWWYGHLLPVPSSVVVEDPALQFCYCQDSMHECFVTHAQARRIERLVLFGLGRSVMDPVLQEITGLQIPTEFFVTASSCLPRRVSPRLPLRY